MLFNPSLDVKAIPTLIQGVFRIAPYALWARRFKNLHMQEAQNPLLTEYFDQQFFLERTFESAWRYHAKTGRYPNINTANYELYSFLAALNLVDERLSKRGHTRLQATIRDGLQDDKGLGPVSAEFRTATHLMVRGFDVQFTDLEDRARYDLLASRGDAKIEIDCKAPSGDVGRKIHGARFRALANELMPALQSLAKQEGGHLLTMTIPGRLHGQDRKAERKLINEAKEILYGRKNPQADLLSIEPFDISGSPFESGSLPMKSEDIAEFLENRFALQNANAACNWLPGRGAVVLVVQSAEVDHVVEGIYRQLKQSAESQFSGSLPAVLCVLLRDVTGPQLRKLGAERVNGLGAIATRLFSGKNRSHLAGICFVAPAGALTRTQSIQGQIMRTSYQDVGAAYVFTNPRHASAAEVDGIFR